MKNKSLSRAYNRDVSKRKALRKRQIIRNIYCWSENPDYYDNLHQYSKNKIHCSCAQCSKKTRNKGYRRTAKKNYNRSINWKKSDLIKIEAMSADLKENI